MTWPAHALAAAQAGHGASEPGAQHTATQRATGAAVELLEQLAEQHAEAARIAQELAQILATQVAGPAPVEAACDPVEQQPFLTVADLAERLNVAPGTVRRWRRQGALPPGIDLGGVVRWRPEVIEAWIAEREEAGR